MKNHYLVLWFDDTKIVFDANKLKIDKLKSTINAIGFDLEIDFRDSPDAFLELSPWKEFDLIVVDYSLDEYSTHGQEFIEKVREHHVYTEVIFYSNKDADELWKAIYDKKLEGVYVANRQNLTTKIEQVATSYIEKVFDIESMRGLVMAQVGDLDIVLDNLLDLSFSNLDDTKQTEILEYFSSTIDKRRDKAVSDKEIFEEDYSIKSLIDQCEGSWIKWHMFIKCAKRHPDLDHSQFVHYDRDVIKKRNALAHGIPLQNENGDWVFNHRGNEFVYNDSVCKKLLNLIRSYKKLFDRVKTDLAPEN